MAGMNKQLEEAVGRFASLPEAGPERAARLRAALEADGTLLKQMNEAAKAGSVRAFAMAVQDGGQVGRLDLSTGTMFLPARGFDPNGSGQALGMVLKVQEMTSRFGRSSYTDEAGNNVRVSQGMVDNLLSAVNSSPELADQISLALRVRPEPHLKGFAVLPHGQGVGAAYDGDSKTMLIPAGRLQPQSATNRYGYEPEAMVFTLAHEMQHGFNHEDKQRAWKAFDAEVVAIARDKNPINDYTSPVKKLVAASRVDEAKAEIAGWNAVLSMKRQSHPDYDLSGMARTPGARPYVFVSWDRQRQEAVPVEGLRFSDDLTISPTPGNVEALGKSYFDREPRRDQPESAKLATLGPHKEADYPNYYGRNAIQRAIYLDREHANSVDGIEPQMHLNMSGLRLDERLIERLGLEIDPRPQQRQPYYDTGHTPPVLRHFDHTKTGPSLNEHVPIEPSILAAPPLEKTESRFTPVRDGHPDHALYSQIVAQVKEQDRATGRSWDQVSERLSASLLVLAKENGLSRVDHVVFSTRTDRVAAGENVFVVQGRLDDPAHVRAHMKTDAAVQTPEAASFDRVEAINDRSAQQASALQAQQQAQDEQARSVGMGR